MSQTHVNQQNVPQLDITWKHGTAYLLCLNF